MLQCGFERDLALEALCREPRGQCRDKQLDDDPAAEARFLSDEHAAHPAAAQLTLDGVRAAQ